MTNETFEATMEECIRELSHTTDGPATPFVMITRAIKLARAGKFPAVGIDDPIANALYGVLDSVEDSNDSETPVLNTADC